MKIIVMPMIGKMQQERLHSLAACHAIYERQVVKVVEKPSEVDAKLSAAVKELLLADRHAALDGKVTFIVQLEL